jgi:hypothetical protein
LFGTDHDEWRTDLCHSDGDGKPGVWRGKVSGLLFDHFGDFEGFTLEGYGGSHHRFSSREGAILELARSALRERFVVTVVTVPAKSPHVRHIMIRS